MCAGVGWTDEVHFSTLLTPPLPPPPFYSLSSFSLSHLPSSPSPKVLVVGGGDGGMLREVAKLKAVKEILSCSQYISVQRVTFNHLSYIHTHTHTCKLLLFPLLLPFPPHATYTFIPLLPSSSSLTFPMHACLLISILVGQLYPPTPHPPTHILAVGFSSLKVKVHFQDGAEFMQQRAGQFDVTITDFSGPLVRTLRH